MIKTVPTVGVQVPEITPHGESTSTPALVYILHLTLESLGTSQSTWVPLTMQQSLETIIEAPITSLDAQALPITKSPDHHFPYGTPCRFSLKKSKRGGTFLWAAEATIVEVAAAATVSSESARPPRPHFCSIAANRWRGDASSTLLSGVWRSGAPVACEVGCAQRSWGSVPFQIKAWTHMFGLFTTYLKEAADCFFWRLYKQ